MQATTKEELIESLRKAHADWNALLERVGQEHMTQPGAIGEWTFKDVIAHLTAWRLDSIERLEAARLGMMPEPTPWPGGLDTDQINDWIYERDRNLPLEVVLRESEETFRRLEDGVVALSEADLLDPGHFEWTDGESLSTSVVESSLGHYYDEHAAAIEDWIEQINA